jgi:hypothetical protein
LLVVVIGLWWLVVAVAAAVTGSIADAKTGDRP